MSSAITRRSRRASGGPTQGIRPRGRTELHCNFCNKIFFKTEHLDRHERSHTKERPFHCETCDKYFSRQQVAPRRALPPSWSERVWLMLRLSDTLLRHFKKLHNVADVESPVPDTSLGTSAETSDQSRELMAHYYAVDTSPPNSMAVLPLSGGSSLTREIAMIQELENVESVPSVTFPDQSWWFDFDFDPNSLDMSLFEPMTFPESSPLQDYSLGDSWLLPYERTLPVRDIQRAWFTYIDDSRQAETVRESAASPPTPSVHNSDTYELDENFRLRACQRLTKRLNIDPLPSTGLLNLTVKKYFDIFAPLFPIFHRHTFRPSPENSPLLLLMSALGCLLEGDVASLHGVRIFERFSSTIMTSWESILRSDSREAISLIQAAVLAQTFGLLSGVPKHLAMVDSFHGTVIAWARRINLFRKNNQYPRLDSVKGLALEDKWKSWAHSEEVLRVVLGLYILDAQIASIFHHDPLLRHDTLGSRLAADEDLFNACNADEWKAKALLKTSAREPQLQRPVQSHQFSSYVTIQNIYSNICEEQSRDNLTVESDEFERLVSDLMNWHSRFDEEVDNQIEQRDSFDLIILWHTAFMNLLVDFNKLERAMGRDGLHNVFLESDMSYAVNWSISTAADRCVLHAYAIQDTLSQMRLSDEPALHVPHCAFLAGIAAYSCLRFRKPAMLARYPPHDPPTMSRSLADFPEFNIHGELERSSLFENTPVLFENERGELFMRILTPHRPVVMVGAEVFRQCYEVLQKMGHFEIARSYAKTLRALIYDEVEKWMHG